MSYSFDGANDRITGAFASTYADPVTLACFVKIAAHPTANDMLVMLGNSASATEDSYSIHTHTVDDAWRATSEDSAGGVSPATVSSINVDGVWAGVVGVFTNGSLRDVYVQSIGNTAQSANSRTVADALQFVRIGEGLGGGNDFAGLIAEVAIWNKALDAAAIESYLGGNIASGIDAANLIGYWPLSADNATQSNLGVDTDGDLAVAGAVFDADHPTILAGGTTLTPNPAGLSV